MFSVKYLIFFLVVHFMLQILDAQPKQLFFRNDYTYNEVTNSFYKLHTRQRAWEQANEICDLEGATLFYPDDEIETKEVIRFWANESNNLLEIIYIGVSTPYARGIFETVDGLPIEEVYDKWSPGEPNDVDGKEGCVTLIKKGTLNDDNCEKYFSFICKKKLNSLEWDMICDMPEQGYEYVQRFGKCYKFHLTPMNWTDAYTACRRQQSYLAVINSQEEANYLVNLTKHALKDQIVGNYLKGAVHLGFKLSNYQWRTVVRNIPLTESGYNTWDLEQPDGKGNENCGSMFYNGHLNDISCDQRLLFICEHEIPLLSNSFILRKK